MVSSFTLDLTVVIKNRTLGSLCVSVERCLTYWKIYVYRKC